MGWLKNAEARMRLNPSWIVIDSKQLNRQPAQKGDYFRFFFQASEKRFTRDIIQIVEKDRIINRAVDQSFNVTLSVIPTERGSRLVHEENLTLPDELLEPRSKLMDVPVFKLLRQKLRMLLGFDYYETEKARKADEILGSLSSALQIWLMRIKEQVELETETSMNVLAEKAG